MDLPKVGVYLGASATKSAAGIQLDCEIEPHISVVPNNCARSAHRIVGPTRIARVNVLNT